MAAKTLNPQQLQAVQHGSGPLLIIAGAGSGKTTVITERIKYLITKKIAQPSEILALTFTEKSAREMEERVDVALPYGYTQMWISTFHAFCDRILRSDAIHIGLNPGYTLMTEAETVQFLKKNIFKFQLSYFRPLGNPSKFLEGMLQHFSRLKDEDISPDEYIRYAQQTTSGILHIENKKNAKLSATSHTPSAESDEKKKTLELAYAYKMYEELKTKEGVMDFSDLISNTLKLFRTRKNILKNYQDKFKFILVDEFQDTNFAQNQLAIVIAGEKKNIAVVGDDDQAIYRWRGAAISNIIQFRQTFPDSEIITLTKNYRSTQEILDRSYRLIQNNNPDRLETREKIDKKLIAARRIQGKSMEFLFAKRVEDEAELVVEKIEKLASKKQIPYKDFAILVRANDHAQSFVRAFLRHNIPFQFLGPGRLFKQEEIKDLIAYLKVLYNFGDSTSLYRILNLPIFGFEARDVAACMNFARRKNYSLFEALELIAEEKPNNHENYNDIFIKDSSKELIKIIISMIKRHLEKVPKETAGQILYYFISDSGLLKKYLETKSEQEEKRFQNIAKFFDKLKTYEAEHDDSSVFAVVEWIDLSMQMGESPQASDSDWSENNAVNILTIHSSKGLEFPVVFLVNLVSQRFPTRERREQIPIPDELIKEVLPSGDFHLQEERRLFYVGMTRAKDFLFITAAHFYGEGKRERKLSPFIYETFGEEFIEQQLQIHKRSQMVTQPTLLEWAEQSVPKQSSLEKFEKPSTHINYVSYSQIQTYAICPLHYKLRYILKIPPQPTASLSFGTSVHATLRDFYQAVIKNPKTKIEIISEILKKDWVNEGYQSKTHEKTAYQKAQHILLKYLKSHFSQKNALPIAVETPFQFTIKGSILRPTGLKIGGRIDRIDKIDERKIEILDYKTGNNVPEEKDLAKDLQLTMYGLAAFLTTDSLFNRKPEDILLSLYYLEEDIKLSTTRSIEELEECKKLIFEKVAEIEKSDFECSRNSLCANCEYKMVCSTTT